MVRETEVDIALTARYMLDGRTGLRRYGWYMKALPRLKGEVGRDEMMHDLMQELRVALWQGLNRQQSIYQAAAEVRRCWNRYGDDAWVELDEETDLNCTFDGTPTTSEDVGGAIDLLRAQLSTRELELVGAAATLGTRPAGRMMNTDHSNVSRALRHARSVLSDYDNR